MRRIKQIGTFFTLGIAAIAVTLGGFPVNTRAGYEGYGGNYSQYNYTNYGQYENYDGYNQRQNYDGRQYPNYNSDMNYNYRHGQNTYSPYYNMNNRNCMTEKNYQRNYNYGMQNRGNYSGRYYCGDYYSNYVFGRKNCCQANRINFQHQGGNYAPQRMIFANRENPRCYFNVENQNYSDNGPRQIVIMVDSETFNSVWNQIMACQNKQFRMDGYMGDYQNYNYSNYGNVEYGNARMTIEPYN